jgi:hypothetical protein
MAITYSLIATVAPTSGASIIDFNNIPATFTDLRLVLNGRSANSANAWIGGSIAINGGAADANINFQRLFAYNTGGSTIMVADTSAGGFGMNNGTSTTDLTYGVGVIYFPNYGWGNRKQAYFRGSSTNITNSSALTIENSANIAITDAITRITLSSSGSTFTTASSASLYGIKKA